MNGKRKLINFSTRLLLFTSIILINPDNYVCGVRYQEPDRPSNGADGGHTTSSSANYKFEYAVVDEGMQMVGAHFGHEEERKGLQTRGRYSVLLPDGRLQVVTYTADKNGYVADITYESGQRSAQKDEAYNAGGYNKGEGDEPRRYEESRTNSITANSPPKVNTKNRIGSSNGKGFKTDDDNAFGKSSAAGRKKSSSFVKSQTVINGKVFKYSW